MSITEIDVAQNVVQMTLYHDYFNWFKFCDSCSDVIASAVVPGFIYY